MDDIQIDLRTLSELKPQTQLMLRVCAPDGLSYDEYNARILQPALSALWFAGLKDWKSDPHHG